MTEDSLVGDLHTAIGWKQLVRAQLHGAVWAKRHRLRQLVDADLERLRPYMVDGTTLIDIGAHAGSWTVPMSQEAGESGHVVAIEALPYYAASLRSLRRLLRLSNTRIINVAVGSEPGQADLVWKDASGASLTGMIHLAAVDEVNAEPISVTVCRLDDLLRHLGSTQTVSFIKIDVEGAELSVLEGAESTIQTHLPVVYLEAEERWLSRYGRSLADIWAFFGLHQYSLYVLDESGLVAISEAGYRSDSCVPNNLVALPSHLARSPAHSVQDESPRSPT